MALIDTLRRRHVPPRAVGTWSSATPSRPAEAVPAPRRRVDERTLRIASPGSLAASVMAAGLEDVDLGLERLSVRRGRTWPVWPLVLVLGISLMIAAGVLWQQLPAATAARSPTGVPPVTAAEAPPEIPNPAALLDPESRRATPAVPDAVPGPGGLAVSIRPVESNYTVITGDTLERIAQRFGTTVDALVGMNNLRDRNSLTVGQKLIIP